MDKEIEKLKERLLKYEDNTVVEVDENKFSDEENDKLVQKEIEDFKAHLLKEQNDGYKYKKMWEELKRIAIKTHDKFYNEFTENFLKFINQLEKENDDE